MAEFAESKFSTRLLLAGVVSAGSLANALMAGHAFAQEDQSPGEVSDETEVIIIQGTKRERQLQEIDDSISVLTGADIVDRNIVDLDDLLKRVANADSTVAFRNLTPAAVPAPDSGAAPSVAVYIDNVRTSVINLPAFNSPNIWDIEQVEVFRGPQSTRQGENTLGGAIIMRSVRPDQEFDARARALYAEHDTIVGSVALGGPLVEDELAGRVSFDYQTTDGFISSPVLDIEDFNRSSRYSGRVALLWTPESLTGFEALLTVTGEWTNGTGSFSLVDNDDDPFDFEVNQSVFLNGIFDQRRYAGSLELNYDLSSAVTLTSVTAYADEFTHRLTQDNAFQDVFDDYFSQELRTQFSVDNFSGIFGLYYSKQTEGFTQDTPATDVNQGRPIPTAFLGPLLVPAAAGMGITLDPSVFAFYPSQIFFESEQDVEIERVKYAVFGEVDWEAIDGLTLTAGLRVDREENTTLTDGFLNIANLADFPDPFSLDPSLTPSALFVNTVLPFLFTAGGTGGLTDEQSNTVVLPRAGVRYQWTPDISTAFTASKGYRSGGVSIRNLGAVAVPYEPETLWNLELSFRSLWFDDRLRFNVNAFYVDWKDQQVVVQLSPSPFDTAIVNAASSTVIGFEIETRFDISDYFSGYVSLGYAKTEFDAFMNPLCFATGGDCSGNEFENSPPWSAALGGVFRHPVGVFAQADLSLRDKAFGSIANNPDGPNYGARTILDAQIGYEQERWKISVFARNLTNDQAIVSSVAAFLTEPLAPRVFGVRLDLRT